jgi:hypothetical protein
MSRSPPPDVASVVLDGMRYEQVTNGLARGLDRLTGYLRAADAATDAERWVVQVYDGGPTDPDLEADVQYLYFRSMTVERGRIVIENEAGARFEVDPQTGAVTAMP